MCYEDPFDSGCSRDLLRALFEKNYENFWKEVYPSWCERCGRLENLTLDHIRPLAIGGDNSISNLQVLCLSCHRKKDIAFVSKHYRLWQKGVKHCAKIPSDNLMKNKNS